MRVSRAWRDIIARIQAGYGHTTEDLVGPGSLAIFCPTCPQPRVNLPDGWEKDKRRWAVVGNLDFTCLHSNLSWLYTRSIVLDGNFTSDHLKMKCPENDICLTPGGRYMVEPTQYEAHLQESIDFQEVSLYLIKGEIYIHDFSEIHMFQP